MTIVPCSTLYILPQKLDIRKEQKAGGCDIYELAPDIALTTGYDPFGNRRLPLAITERYEKKAKQILEENSCNYTAKEKLEVLLNELVAEIRTL